MRSASLASLFCFFLFGSLRLVASGADPLAITIREGHPGGVTAMAFSTDGERFASGAGNGIVRIWDSNLKQLGKREEFKGISITGLAYSPDGRILAASGKGKAGIWHENILKVEPTPKKGKSTIFDPQMPQASASVFAWTPFPSTDSDVTYSDISVTGDGKLIYFLRRSTYHGGVMRYDVLRDVTEERPGPKRPDPRAVASISDPDSGATSVYATLEKGEPAILLYGLGEPRTIIRGVPPIISKAATPRIAYSIDGAWLAACSGSLAVWPVPGSHVIGGDPVIIRDVYAAALGPYGMLATVSSPDEHRKSEITFWRLRAQGQPYGLFGIRVARPAMEVRKIATHPSTLKDVGCLAFSPNGRLLAIGGETDGVILLWDMSFLNGR